jgi:hypothetical protein
MAPTWQTNASRLSSAMCPEKQDRPKKTGIRAALHGVPYTYGFWARACRAHGFRFMMFVRFCRLRRACKRAQVLRNGSQE